ncbi:MAG: hypothetical protein V3U36_00265 [Anaerolineales bacterium]
MPLPEWMALVAAVTTGYTQHPRVNRFSVTPCSFVRPVTRPTLLQGSLLEGEALGSDLPRGLPLILRFSPRTLIFFLGLTQPCDREPSSSSTHSMVSL